MSKRQEIRGHLGALSDIGGILGAMKNLALMEIHKLNRFLTTQQRVVTAIDQALSDVSTSYPLPPSESGIGTRVYVVLGSERGFCGEFNETLVTAFEQRLEEQATDQTLVIAVGHKLLLKLEVGHQVDVSLAGPNVTEEIQPVLIRLMDVVRDLQSQQKPGHRLDLIVLSHGSEEDGRLVQIRRPFHHTVERHVGFPHSPVLNLQPPVLLSSLMDHYLFAVLHELFYSSLMAENRRRFQHMDQALQRLEKDITELTLRHQVLRQEEITEEIQVIMLSAEAIGNGRQGPGTP
jgi:F-type H+-transporting ATPase subunit gamma